MSARRGERHDRRGVIWLVISAMAYSTYVVLMKGAIAAGVNALTVMAVHFSLAGLVWWIVLSARRRPVWPGARRALQATALGVFVYAPSSFTFYQGTARVSGTIASLTFAMVPLVVAVLAWLFLRERLGWLGWVALALAVAGGVTLIGEPEGQVDAHGLLWLGATAALIALYFVLSTPLTRSLSPMHTTTYVISGASIFFLVWGGVSGGLDFAFARIGWLAILGLALLPTFIGMYTFMLGVGIVGATRASIVSALEPVLAVVLAVLILAERPSSLQMVGGALVIVASILVQLDTVRAPAEPKSVATNSA